MDLNNYILFNRSEPEDANTSSDASKSRRIYYRTAQILHILATEAFQFLLQLYIVLAELLVLGMLYIFIRNLTPPTFIAVPSGIVGGACLMCISLAFGSAAIINESSRSIFKLVKKTTKEQKALLRSLKPMVIRVGPTFTISSQTFPNMVDQVLSNLVNLLVTFN